MSYPEKFDCDKSKDTMNNFIKNLKEKLRTDIAGMLPDDVLENLARQCVKDEFFTKRTIYDRYGNITETKNSFFQEMVFENAKPIIQEYTKKFCEENKKVFEEQMIEILKTGLMDLLKMSLQRTIVEAVTNDSYVIANAIRNQLGNR